MKNLQLFKLPFYLVMACIAMGSSGTAFAQTPSSNSSRPPRRPSLSPYLNLEMGNSGALPSYHAFVLPRMEQQKMQMKQYSQQVQMREQKDLVDGNLRTTGMHSQFQNLSHFYTTPRTNGQQR